MGFRRGDIVWARVVFPSKWWPALVRSINGNRVAVSFFDHDQHSRYFLETEVRSFEENFDSLVKTIKKSSRGEELLDSALRSVARRAAYGLRCPCHFRSWLPAGRIANRRRKGGELFQPDALLSFVLGLAVSPFVRDSDFVGAVTIASQLNVFRRYLVVEGKPRHPKTAGACSVAEISDVSKMGFACSDCWDQPNNESRIQGNNADSQSLDRTQLNVNGPDFDDNHTSELQLYQPSVKINGKRKTCSDISTPPKPSESRDLKRRYDHPVDSEFHFKFCENMPLSQGFRANAQTSKIRGTVCEMESPILKPSVSDNHLKFCNRMPLSFSSCTDDVVQRCEENSSDSFSSDFVDKARHCLPSTASGGNRNLCVENNTPESINAHSIQMEHSTSINNHQVSIESSTQDSIDGAFNSRESSVENKSLLPLVNSEALSYMPQEAHDTLIDNSTDSPGISVETSGLECIDEAIEKTSQADLQLAHALAQQLADAILVERNASIDYRKVSIENSRLDTINGASSSRVSCMEHKLLLPMVTSDAPSSTPQEAQPLLNGSVKASIYERIDALFCLKESSTEKNSQVAQQSAHSNQIEHIACLDNQKISVKNGGQRSIKATPHKAQESTNASTKMNRMDHSRGCRNISVNTNRRKRIDAAFSLKESPTEKKSKVDFAIYGSCQKLYMKFPKDFNLPSKKDLIKIFRRFGLIDLVRTKVFEQLGSAQVVFLHHFDAATAYQYAKLKKSLFNGAQVLFWLDPHEKKRSHSTFAAPLPKLKSCLKNPYSCQEEHTKPSKKVRFLMQSWN